MGNYVQLKEGVFVCEESLDLLKQTDSLVLDIDGVIVDVTSSFRVAISKTVQYFLTEILSFSGKGILLTPQETQFFKLAGGFNNDWELTYAAVLFYLGKSVKHSTKEISKLRLLPQTLKQFASEVKGKGGGLEAAKHIVFADLKKQEREQLKEAWNKDLIKQIFQEVYGGIDYCERLYGFSPSYIKGKGLINEEKLILNKKYLELFLPKVAILTGRTSEEAEVALEKASLSNLIQTELVLSDEGGLRKPDPQTLYFLGKRMKTAVGLYIGDVPDDLETVNNFRNLDAEMQFISGIVCREGEEEMYKGRRVDILASKTDDLLATLLDLKGEKQSEQPQQ